MEAFRRLVTRWFPILKNNDYAPRLGKVINISDAPATGGQCTYKRPMYAVDLQPLDAHFNKSGPLLRDVVCSMPYAGKNRGLFALPDTGTIVEYTQSYCLPHLIHIRGVIPWGLDLPPLDKGESRWQQSDRVYQGYDKSGNWHKVTDKDIRERCEQIHTSAARLKQLIKVDNGGTIWLGNGSDNVLKILSDFMHDTSAALEALATHTHGGPPPDQSGSISGKAGNISSSKNGRLDGMVE